MTLRTPAFYLIIPALCFWGCDGNPSGPESTSFFAHVVDASGQPVPDVAVHYMFDLVPRDQLNKRSGIAPRTTIQFSLPDTASIVLTIHRWHTRELLDTLASGTYGPGMNAVQFDMASYTNGLYIYRPEYDTTVIERTMMLSELDLNVLSAAQPFAVTDASGRLAIPVDMFGFGVPLPRTSPNGETTDTVYVSPAVDIVLVKEGFQTLVRSVIVGPNVAPGPKFVLIRK